MSWLSIIATLIGKIIREIIPAFYAELRRPRKTHQVGGSEELFEEVNDSVRGFYRDRDNHPGTDPDRGDASRVRAEGPASTAPPSSSLDNRFEGPPSSILPGSGH